MDNTFFVFFMLPMQFPCGVIDNCSLSYPPPHPTPPHPFLFCLIFLVFSLVPCHGCSKLGLPLCVACFGWEKISYKSLNSMKQDIVWHAFKENCTAKMIQRTAFSSPHSGTRQLPIILHILFKLLNKLQLFIEELLVGCVMIIYVLHLVSKQKPKEHGFYLFLNFLHANFFMM